MNIQSVNDSIDIQKYYEINFSSEANNIFESYDKKLKSHRAINHDLFNYLNKKRNIGFTQGQYKTYRDNFLLRTFNTISSVAKVVIAAAKYIDYPTLAEIGKNLYQETGEGNYENSHLYLLEKSHNVHGQKIFNLPPISLVNVSNSEFVVTHNKEFLDVQNRLYENDSYLIVLGASYAHESAAESMLGQFESSLFDIYSGYYDETEYKTLCKYFSVHLNGVEHEHGVNAKKALLRICRTEENLKLVFNAANAFLDAQAHLWDGMLLKIREFEHETTVKPLRR
jgi:hypothetical protein